MHHSIIKHHNIIKTHCGISHKAMVFKVGIGTPLGLQLHFRGHEDLDAAILESGTGHL